VTNHDEREYWRDLDRARIGLAHRTMSACLPETRKELEEILSLMVSNTAEVFDVADDLLEEFCRGRLN